MIARKGAASEADVVGTVSLGDNELGVAQYNGTLQRFKLYDNGKLTSTAHYPHPRGENIYTISASEDGSKMMTTTSGGVVYLFSTRSPWIEPETIHLPAEKGQQRAWSSLVSTSLSSPSFFLGLYGGIHVHNLNPSATPSSTPTRILQGPEAPSSKSSAYDIHLPSPSSAHNPNLLLSAWYDSEIRLHDLRSPSSYPVMSFFDPYQWADGSAIYSAAYIAENGIAGGGARHGSVSLFDIRQPKTGWSISTPGGKGSPVYALQGDGGRLWGVTQRRAFVLAFDGSGDVEEGMVLHSARAPKDRVSHRPSGWTPRGGKWGWTVRYDEGDASTTGYEHHQRGVTLFDSRPVV